MLLYIVIYLVFGIILLSGCKLKKSQDCREWFEKEKTDALRGIAILTIVFHHISAKAAEELPYSFFFVNMGFAAVALFFLLSGYVHSVNYKNREVKPSFFLKKFQRMLVPYLVIWVIYLAAALPTTGTAYYRKMLTAFFTLGYPDTLCWYFKVQLLLYLFFFGVYYLAKKLSNTGKNLIIGLITLVYMGICIWQQCEPYWYMTVLYFPMGLFLGEYQEVALKGMKKCGFPVVAAAGAVFALLQVYTFFRGFGNAYYSIHTLMAFAFVVMMTGLLYYCRFSSGILSLLGKCSLELYLIHGIILCAEPFGKWYFVKNVDLIVYLALSLGVSVLVHFRKDIYKNVRNRFVSKS